ncbi:MAG: hypothetical protein O9318_11335 [Hylemonella sp.]|uniref:hypothetical protein n=1 Tax=Hylemonella sp. TaxID=2066020 RepID=UPI0022BA7DE8|nr:hypothetical protein [Hylemonella sp.]MCZ8253056.1 hypothetical protein [Hylemonella sp.]
MNPSRYIAESMDEVRRSSKDHVFSIIFDTRPAEGNRTKSVGAFALCWVDAETLLEAEKIAVDKLIEAGWIPTRFEEHDLVSCDSDRYGQEGYSEDEISAVLARVAMAQKYGFYAQYHEYLSDEEEQ